jgi:glycine/D-amino acid oxidase-like deaminating enzyme
MRVLLVDQYGPANSRSSSGGESRIIRMGYGSDEIYTRSAKRSLNHWLAFSAKLEESIFHRTGVLWLARDSDPYVSNCVETLARTEVPFEKLSTTEIGTRFPQLNLSGISWALFEPESGALMARRAVQTLVRTAIGEGVVYRHSAVSVSASGEVTVGDEKIEGGAFIFACGPWLPRLFPDLLRNRISLSRQEVYFFGPQRNAERFSPAALPIWVDFSNEAYGFPDLESRGVKIAIDRHGPDFDPDLGDRVTTSEGLAEVRRYISTRIPDLKDASVLETRVCQYENTSNGDFLVDRHPEHQNMWLVGGGSGHGFKHGPSVAEYLVARLKGNEDVESRFSLATKFTTQERAVF